MGFLDYDLLDSEYGRFVIRSIEAGANSLEDVSRQTNLSPDSVQKGIVYLKECGEIIIVEEGKIMHFDNNLKYLYNELL